MGECHSAQIKYELDRINTFGGEGQMIVENEFPILEYSTEQNAVINPGWRGEQEKGPFPRLCIMTFFKEEV